MNGEILKRAIKCSHEFDAVCNSMNCDTCDYYYDDGTQCEVIYAYGCGFADGIEKGMQLSSEKQIPKKPKRNNTLASKLFHKTSCYTCPTCGNGLLTKRMNERQNTRFCWDCGQKLDWREGENK